MTSRILIVDDVATNRIVLKVKLAEAGYHPLLAVDGKTALAIARAERPDLVLLDLVLPDQSGIAVLTQLRQDPTLRGVPVVVISASTDPAQLRAAFRAGADDFLAKPMDDLTLLARIRGLLRARAPIEGFAGAAASDATALFGMAEPGARFYAPALIALVLNRPDTALHLRRSLAPYLPDRLQVMTGEEALTAGLGIGPGKDCAPDVFVIDADYRDGGGGLRLMSELRSRHHSCNAAFCLMAGADSDTAAAVAYDLGAHDLVSDAVAGEELALRLQRILARKREADEVRASVQDRLRMAMIDPLTGLHNRRFGLARLGAIAETARRAGQDFAVMVVDLDRFKSVNDHFGHAAGDAVLVEVAARLGENLRKDDLLARIGGEEFLIALPDTNLLTAQSIAERLCRAVQERPVPLPGFGEVRVTVSIGLAVNSDAAVAGNPPQISEIVNRADRALLLSKTSGRNQVTISRNAA